MSKRMVFLAHAEFEALRSLDRLGGVIVGEVGDTQSRATLLREGMLRVVAGHDVLTGRAYRFIDGARDDGLQFSAHLDDGPA